MNTLHDIYSEKYTPSKAAQKTPFSLRLEERAFFDAIEEAMGADFLERHRDGLGKLEDYKAYASFREGFRLGVSLMLELL